MIFLLLATLWLGGYLALNSGLQYQSDIDEKQAAATKAGTTVDVSDDEYTRNWCYVGCGFIWFFAFIATCCMCCNFHRIRLVINIIKASARFINNNLMILLAPVFNTLWGLGWFVFWLVGFIYLYSVGTVTQNTTYPWSNVEWDQYTKIGFYFNLVFGLWLIAFMVSFNVFVIAAASVIWYFQQGEGQEEGQKSKKNPCCTGYCWAMGIHMGSIAFGSFILMVVWAIQIFFAVLEYYMKDKVGKNCCVKLMFKYIHCCLACFERLIQFLNKQGYIQVA